MKPPILIASSSLDEHAYAPVQNILEQKDHPVILYRTDKVLEGKELFKVAISEDGVIEASYEDQPISPETLGAAWCRKIGAFAVDSAKHDRAKQLYITNEIRLLHEAIWSLYPDELWLNPPTRMRVADGKLGQLLLAKELGMEIPETVISNDWDAISSKLLTDDSKMVVKMVRGVISENEKIKALYTTPLDETDVSNIRHKSVPFPGIYQPFVDKFREWRITVVGERIFAAAIYTDETAKDDWRLHQMTDSVRFEAEAPPENIGEKCIQFLKNLKLKFGAFDFIEKQDGEMVFLECNPNGQYGWLEKGLGLPISQAIADELVGIANGNRY